MHLFLPEGMFNSIARFSLILLPLRLPFTDVWPSVRTAWVRVRLVPLSLSILFSSHTPDVLIANANPSGRIFTYCVKRDPRPHPVLFCSYFLHMLNK